MRFVRDQTELQGRTLAIDGPSPVLAAPNSCRREFTLGVPACLLGEVPVQSHHETAFAAHIQARETLHALSICQDSAYASIVRPICLAAGAKTIQSVINRIL